MNLPQVPEDFYTGLGKVVAAAANLEYDAAFLVTLAHNGSAAEMDKILSIWNRFESAHARAVKALESISPPLAQQVDALPEKIKALRDERNRVAHSLIVANHPLPEDEDQRITLVHVHAKGGVVHALPTATDLRHLCLRITGLDQEVIGLANAVAEAVGRDFIPGEDGGDGSVIGGQI